MQQLRYLVHFYNSEDHLFKTVTMHRTEEREQVLDAVAGQEGWFWGRFAASERARYMARRVAVEEMLHTEFEGRYGPLKSEQPVYLYLIPAIDIDQPDLGLGNSRLFGGRDTRYILFDLDKIPVRSNITFTVGDSLRSYRAKLLAQGVPCEPLVNRFDELQDYGQVFPIDALAEVHQRSLASPDLTFEIQVWDSDLLIDYLAQHQPERRSYHPDDSSE